MAIMTESQVFVDCDCCGRVYATQIMNQKETMKMLRGKGWTFGKEVKCFECARRRGNDNELRQD